MIQKALMEKTIPYSPHLGMLFGCCGALFLQQVHYWCEVNKEKKQSLAEGHYWCYNTYKEWEEQFLDFDQSTLRRKIQLLVSAGVLVMGRFNKHKYDKTNWYRVDYEVLEKMLKDSPMPCSSSQSNNDPLLKLEGPTAQIGQSDTSKLNTPIPETTQSTTPENPKSFTQSVTKENTVFDKTTAKGKKPLSAMDILKQHKAAKNPNAPALATVTSLVGVWQHTVPKYTEVKFVGSFTMAQKGMFSKLIARWGGSANPQIHDCLTHILMHWVKFSKAVEESAGLKISPGAPSIAFLLKYAEEGLNFYHKSMSAPVPSATIKVKVAAPVVAAPVAAEEVPMTLEELEALGEKYGYGAKT
jgi:hypothetical protein